MNTFEYNLNNLDLFYKKENENKSCLSCSSDLYNNNEKYVICDKYKKIINFIDKNKSKINNCNNVINTITGIGLLNEFSNGFERSTLTKQVYDLTGIPIHANENYSNIDIFKQTILMLEEQFIQAFDRSNDMQKLHLLNYGVTGGCFELQAEGIMDFIRETQSLYGLLKYEIMDLNRLQGHPLFNPVSLENLIDYLKTNQFFELNKIDEIEFLSDPVIAKLQLAGFIVSEQTVLEKINEAFGLYDNFGKGIEEFKSFLLEKANLNESEKQNIDQSISAYFKVYSDRKHWL